MTGRESKIRQNRIFAVTACTMLLMSVLILGISVNIPNAGAISHDVGNLDVNMPSDFGRIFQPLKWNTKSQTVQDPSSLGFIGLVIDHSQYDHTPGSENIADSFETAPYFSDDDFEPVKAIAMIIDDGITEKSFASFQNKGPNAPFANDLLINQTIWTVKDKDWAILQWTLKNIKTPSTTLSNVRIGLEVPISKAGGRYGLGGNLADSGDDVDGYDSTNDIYWAQDLGDGTTLGFGSAFVSDPITHYFADDYNAVYSPNYVDFFEDDTWLYSRISAPSATATDGVNPENITATVGWDGFDILSGESRTVTMVIAMNNSLANMVNTVKDAQNYYQQMFTSFHMTEVSESGPGSAKIEVYNNGHKPTDPSGLLTFEADSVPLTGTWTVNPVPMYGHSTFVVNEPVNSEGATITLFESGVPKESVSFGQKGTAPDPLNGGSISRHFDTNFIYYTNEWLHDSPATWDAENSVGTIDTTPNVVLNRVMFNPISTVEGYVELMAKGSANVTGYKIICDSEFVIPSTPVLNPSNSYYVFRQVDDPAFFANMDASGDNVYLYDNNDNLLDMVGWNSPHNQGEFMTRTPDGFGTFQGFDDATSTAAGWVFDNLPNLEITEFAVTDANTVRVELYNPRGGDKDLATSWTLDVLTAPNTMTGTWTPSGVMAAGGYSYFDRTGGAQIRPEGDTISLYHRGTEFNGDVSFGTAGIVPDPAVGESTARYWDGTIPGYTNVWNRNGSAGPTWGSQNSVPPVNPTPSIIMNEVMFNPSLNPDGKYVVLMNINPLIAYDISNYILVCDDAYRLPVFPTTPGGFNGVLYPGWSFIVRYGDDSPASDNFFQNMDAAEDNVYLYDDNGELLDMVGWNTPHNLGMSVIRVPDGFGTYQGRHDASSIAAGWVFDNPIQALITEISDSESAQARIEVYNPWYPTIDFSAGFSFDSISGITGNWVAPGTASAGEYVVFDVTSGLGFEGDIISFYQGPVLIDTLSYGQNGLVPDPLKDESVQRYWTGASYNNVWERNWSTGPNFGAQSNVPLEGADPLVVLNEILFNPSSPSDAFVELYLTIGVQDISGYKIVGDKEYIVPPGTFLTPDDPFFYLLEPMDPAFFSSLSNSGDNIYLYNDNGSLLDMAGWSSLHTQGMSMARIPHGNGTKDGYDDPTSTAAGWVFDSTPSIQMVKISSLEPEKEIIGYGKLAEVLTYNLTLTNKQSVDDMILLFNSTLNGYPVLILDETGTFVITELFVPAGQTVNFVVRIFFPTSIPFIAFDNITITAQSENSSLYSDFIIIQAKVIPFIEPKKYVTPQDINLNGVGGNDIATITLNLTGMGSVMSLIDPQDVIFCVDTSGSMTQQSIDLAKAGLTGYVDEMSDPDMGAVVIFGNTVELVNGNGLTTNYTQLKGDIASIPSPNGGTPMGEALQLAIDELLLNGNPEHIQVIILLTDGVWNGVVNPVDQANRAAGEGIMIFTIGLGAGVDEATLINIANITGGQYFYVDNPNDLPGIYLIIAAYIGDVAGRDTDTSDATPMIRDVLPPWIELVPGSFSLPPDINYVNSTGYRILEWNVSSIGINESWEVTFQVKSNMPGLVRTNDYISSRVYYEDYLDNVEYVLFPECTVNVLPGVPLPPLLEIEKPNINDILLKWDTRISPGTHHYLIYRSDDPTQFDFSIPWIDTSVDKELGEPMAIPGRTTWNDTGAADSSEQWYYCIRAVNNQSQVSYSSRTVGKWTTVFDQGVTSFSLPLEPVETITPTVDFFLNDMGADYIKWMDPSTNEWVQHGGGPVNDGPMEVGRGYEVYFAGLNNKYTFLGIPGAQIKYHSRSTVGFDPVSEADSLYATVDPLTDEISLFWTKPANMFPGHNYTIYRSTTRDGFDDGSAQFVTSFSVGPLTWKDPFVSASAGTEYYYMIVPVNETGVEGASTYSIGVFTLDISSNYDTLGIPLQLYNGDKTADYYCDEIAGSVGINFFIEAEQRWSWHSTVMASGVYDPQMIMLKGYQVSTAAGTKCYFVGR